MFNVIYTYESVLPHSEGELKSHVIDTVDTVEEAREVILNEFDSCIGQQWDDVGEGDQPTDYLVKHFTDSYSIEAVAA